MKTLITALAAVVSLAGVASAGTVNAEDILMQFTVVALGNHTSTSHMVGSVYVGKNFTAAQSINGGVENATLADTNGTLIVGGNIVGGGNVTVNGNVVVGGAVVDGSRVNMNNGKLTQGADVPVDAVADAMRGLSTSLSALDETGGDFLSGDSNNPRLNVGAAGADGIAVINLTSGELSQLFAGNPGFIFAGGSPITTVINVAGTSFHQASGRNFNGFNGSNNVIFNFYQATSIILDSPFGASILAPLADVHINTGGSDVFVVGNNIFQKAEIRKPFSGDLPDQPDAAPQPVPLPAAGLLLACGLAGFGALARRRTA